MPKTEIKSQNEDRVPFTEYLQHQNVEGRKIFLVQEPTIMEDDKVEKEIEILKKVESIEGATLSKEEMETEDKARSYWNANNECEDKTKWNENEERLKKKMGQNGEKGQNKLRSNKMMNMMGSTKALKDAKLEETKLKELEKLKENTGFKGKTWLEEKTMLSKETILNEEGWPKRQIKITDEQNLSEDAKLLEEVRLKEDARPKREIRQIRSVEDTTVKGEERAMQEAQQKEKAWSIKEEEMVKEKEGAMKEECVKEESGIKDNERGMAEAQLKEEEMLKEEVSKNEEEKTKEEAREMEEGKLEEEERVKKEADLKKEASAIEKESEESKQEKRVKTNVQEETNLEKDVIQSKDPLLLDGKNKEELSDSQEIVVENKKTLGTVMVGEKEVEKDWEINNSFTAKCAPQLEKLGGVLNFDEDRIIGKVVPNPMEKVEMKNDKKLSDNTSDSAKRPQRKSKKKKRDKGEQENQLEIRLVDKILAEQSVEKTALEKKVKLSAGGGKTERHKLECLSASNDEANSIVAFDNQSTGNIETEISVKMETNISNTETVDELVGHNVEQNLRIEDISPRDGNISTGIKVKGLRSGNNMQADFNEVVEKKHLKTKQSLQEERMESSRNTNEKEHFNLSDAFPDENTDIAVGDKISKRDLKKCLVLSKRIPIKKWKVAM